MTMKMMRKVVVEQAARLINDISFASHPCALEELGALGGGGGGGQAEQTFQRLMD